MDNRELSIILREHMDELITVIVLMFNSMGYIYECLESICNQTYKNIELIIGDDASEDFSLQLVEQYLYKTKFSNIKHIDIYQNDANIGIIKNYRKALQRSHGEYIFYLAADDIFYDNWVLSDVYHFFKVTKCKIVTGYRECFDSKNNRYLRPRECEVSALKELSTEQKFSRILQKNVIAGACTPFHKSTIGEFQKIQKYHHLEDWPRYLNILYNDIDIGFIERKLIKYRVGGLTSHNLNSNLINDYCKLFNEYMNPIFDNLLQYLNNSANLIAIWENKTSLSDCQNFEQSLAIEIKLYLHINEIQILKQLQKPFYMLIFVNDAYYQLANQLEVYGFKEGQDFSRIFHEKILYLQINRGEKNDKYK